MAVWVTTAHGAGKRGVLIGPFTDAAQAHTWTQQATTTDSNERHASFPLPDAHDETPPLQPIEVQIIALQRPDGTDPDGERAVVAFDTEDVGWQVFGPFADTLQATAYYHEIGSVLTFTNARAVHILPVHVPDPHSGSIPLPPLARPAAGRLEPVMPHIVMFEAADDTMHKDDTMHADDTRHTDGTVHAVGWFADVETAERWLATHRTRFSHVRGNVSQVHKT